MNIFYADSSVLVKRHIDETGSVWVRELVASGNVFITAQISPVEVVSALNRLRREGRLTQTDYARIANDFMALCQTQYEIIQISDAIIEQAKVLLEQYPLRAYDAVQLASAISANGALQASGSPALTFLAADNRLLDAAQAAGLAVDNPNDYL